MTQLRTLKIATICAFLVLAVTAWVYKFSPSGYAQTLGSLHKGYGDAAYLFIVIFSVGSLVSIPIFGIAGIVGMAASRRLGRSALLMGLLCCVFSLANFELWKKYGGVPSHDKPEGIQIINQTASRSKAPHP